MGSLTLPTSGPVYLDANGFIYSVEKIEPYRTLLKPLWNAAQQGAFEIISSELVVMETLVKPIRDGETAVENAFRALLFASLEVRLVPTTLAIWEEAARLRAEYNLKTPDAIHAASALTESCTMFLTNDAGFRRVADLPVVLMNEVLAEP